MDGGRPHRGRLTRRVAASTKTRLHALIEQADGTYALVWGRIPAPGLPSPAEGGTASGSALAVARHAIWKAAISAAADWRATLAAGAAGAS